MAKILSRKGLAPQVSGFFFKLVVQLVLIFGAETWVVTPLHGLGPRGFQDHVVRRLTGRLPWRRTVGKRGYTSGVATIEEAGIVTMEEIIRRRQNNVAQFIATQSLLYLSD